MESKISKSPFLSESMSSPITTYNGLYQSSLVIGLDLSPFKGVFFGGVDFFSLVFKRPIQQLKE